MAAVMALERRLGHDPVDASRENLGYDIESVIHLDGGREKLRFIEVKGRVSGAPTVTITRNEILCAFNKPDDWGLALVEVPRLEGFSLSLRERPRSFRKSCSPNAGYVMYGALSLRSRILRSSASIMIGESFGA
ncbi:DUF3883 domain-containing protein [Thermosulfuriphilus ammonigenes]|uniref:DUF3883 domain-containing protein n=2 Tax=Thermosulfuriphilus ammonigenes TaxID=1936021 RepID=UPI003CCD8092